MAMRLSSAVPMEPVVSVPGWVGIARVVAALGLEECRVLWGGTSSESQGWPWIGMCMILEAGSKHLCGSRGQGWLWIPTQWLYWVPGPGH